MTETFEEVVANLFGQLANLDWTSECLTLKHIKRKKESLK